MPRVRCRPRFPDLQLDLFPASPLSTMTQVPAWKALPDQARHVVTGLITRLLIAHAGAGAPGSESVADER